MMNNLIVKDKQFYKTVLKLASPVILQSVITTSVNMLDTLMLASFSEVLISGSSLANSFIAIFQILCMGIGGGAAVLTAQYWGAGDKAAVQKTTVLMLRIASALALVFFAVTMAFPEFIMRIYTPDPEVIKAGSDYLRIISPTYILSSLSLTMTIVLRSVREVKLPLKMAIISFFTNLSFNYVLIFGKLGFPALDIRGAALATVLARLIETVVILGYVFTKDKRIELRVKHLFQPCKQYLSKYLKYSVPVIISDFLLGLGNTAVTIIMGHISTAFTSANAIIAMTVRLSTVMNQGFSNAGGIVTGNTLGRGEREKAHLQGKTFLLMSLALGILSAGIILIVCPFVIRACNIAESTKEIAFQLMYSVAIMVIFQSTQSMLTKGVLRGGGDTRFLVVADIAFLWLLSIPLGCLSGFVWKMSPFWIYLLMKIDYLFKSVWCTFRLFGKKWITVVSGDKKAASR